MNGQIPMALHSNFFVSSKKKITTIQVFDIGGHVTFWQEILGYNVHMNFDNPGPGTADGYFGVAGCKTYNNPNDRGCMQGVAWCFKETKFPGIE